MDFDGSTVYTLYGYKPDTLPAIDWHQISNGNWRGSDRGASEDIFMADVIFEGPRTELETLESFLDGDRYEFDATFGTGEEVFGADIDYSSAISVTVINYSKISQLGYNKWGMRLKLRAYQPAFLSVSESLAELRLSSHVSDQYSEFDLTKNFSYDETTFFNDHAADPGFFEGVFTQTTDEMKAIRRYLLNTLRNGSASPFPSFGGITTPFGYREGTGPFTFRVVEWEDMGRPNFRDWILKIKFAREFT
jgi:hypothetical protein